MLTLCAICWLPEKTRWLSPLGLLLLLSLSTLLRWDCQGPEFGDSFQVWFANDNVWLSVGFPWCSWPMALNFFRIQWAHCITQMASCKWCLRNEKARVCECVNVHIEKTVLEHPTSQMPGLENDIRASSSPSANMPCHYWQSTVLQDNEIWYLP